MVTSVDEMDVALHVVVNRVTEMTTLNSRFCQVKYDIGLLQYVTYYRYIRAKHNTIIPHLRNQIT